VLGACCGCGAAAVAKPHPCPNCGGTGFVVDPDPPVVVRAIFDHIGNRDFTVAQLGEHCVEDRALDDALVGLDHKKIGKLLEQAVGVDHDGLIVVRLPTKVRGAGLWKIAGSPRTPTEPL